MAIIYGTGFENSTSEQIAFSTGTFSYDSTTKKTGTYSLRCNPVGAALGAIGLSYPTAVGAFPQNGTANLYTKFDLYVASRPAALDEQIYCTANHGSGVPKFDLRLDNTGVLKFYDTTPTLVATGTTVLATSTWYQIEVRSGNGASATYEVKINGTTEFSGTCNQQAVNNGGLNFGKYSNRNGGGYDIYFDNIVYSDTEYPGAILVASAAPTGTASNAWTGGTNLSNHLEIDDFPTHDTDTTYIKSAGAAGDEALFTFPNMASLGVTGSIKAIKATSYHRKESGTSATQLRIKSGASVSSSTSEDRTTSYAARCLLALTDPSTTAPWTAVNANSVQLGIKENNAVLDRCTQLVLSVFYNPNEPDNGSGGSRLTLMGIG